MTTSMDLGGAWRLTWRACGQPVDDILQPGFIPEGWLDTQVPEDVRTALRRQGIISGHYYGKNLDAERWIDDSDWLYHRRFFVEGAQQGAKQVLCFDGLDTLAEVWLNGKRVASTDNMFREYRLDVTDALRYGATNTLVVRILSPIQTIKDVPRDGLYPQEDTSRLLIRKSQMNYGWDFCGHCLTGGIWRGVRLETIRADRFAGVFLRTVRLDGGHAVLEARAEVEAFDTNGQLPPRMVKLSLRRGGQCITVDFPADGLPHELSVPGAQLWWPRPYGEAALYDVQALLQSDGETIDSRAFRFGIRTVRVIQDPLPEGGRSFIFEINGRRLFIRGANWVPLNAVYAEIQDGDYDRIFPRVLDSNLSMLRIWGGGIYEPAHFFDLCDEHGIMVFQDFMLACGIFPQDDDMVRQVQAEAGEIIRRYYNRASLVFWSGDNEVDQAYWWYDMQAHYRENRLNRVGIRSAIEANDPHRPFIISSPGSPFEDEPGGDDPNSPLQGDLHIYLTRFDPNTDAYYYKELLDFVPRFMSEYGFSSLPSMDSFGKFNFFRETMDMQRNPWLAHHKVMENPQSAEEAIRLSQYSHAQGLKYFIENLRSHKWLCGGSLYWKFNDPVAPNRENMLFPSLMSSVDFYGLPKLAYYYARRAYEDRILAFREAKDGGIALYACDETGREDRGLLRVSLLDFDGNALETWENPITMAADSATPVWEAGAAALARYPVGTCYLRAVFAGSEGTLVNRYWPGGIGDWLGVIPPKATIQCDAPVWRDGALEMRMKTDRYAQDVQVAIPGADASVFYSENGFTLDAGEAITIRMAVPERQALENLLLRVKGVNTDEVIVDLNEALRA